MKRHKLIHGMCIISDGIELPVCNDNRPVACKRKNVVKRGNCT